MKRLYLSVTPLALLVVNASVASCSSSDGASSPSDAGAEAEPDPRPPTPPEWDRSVVRPDESRASQDRAACKFARGALADETLGSSIPVGKDIPIDTIVVIMQENRSFDHYYGRFGKYAGRTDVDGPPDDFGNPEDPKNPQSPRRVIKRGEHLCFVDTDHGWGATHTQYNDGKMDGFFVTNHGPGPLESGERALWWYDERELPYYYALAKEFGLSDRYFSSLLGPTWPNRMFLAAGTSFGKAANVFPDLSSYPFPDNDAVILDELEKRHVDWQLYTSGGPPGFATLLGPSVGTRWNRDVVDTLDDLLQAAKNGTLPSVVFFDANFLKEGVYDSEDEHPPGDIQIGQKLVADVIKAVMTGPQWKRAAIFLTYDEHGGIFDHVAPPKACPPDDLAPVDKNGAPAGFAFDRYGIRVPLLVVSPYTKKGYVSHEVYDHTSILRFIQARFRVPALTKRDANAAIPLDFFDFQSPPNLVPPTLPEPTIDPAELAYCKQTFGK